MESEKGEGLDGFAEAHLVRQDAAKILRGERGEPLHTGALIIAQLLRERAERGDRRALRETVARRRANERRFPSPCLPGKRPGCFSADKHPAGFGADRRRAAPVRNHPAHPDSGPRSYRSLGVSGFGRNGGGAAPRRAESPPRLRWRRNISIRTNLLPSARSRSWARPARVRCSLSRGAATRKRPNLPAGPGKSKAKNRTMRPASRISKSSRAGVNPARSIRATASFSSARFRTRRRSPSRNTKCFSGSESGGNAGPFAVVAAKDGAQMLQRAFELETE